MFPFKLFSCCESSNNAKGEINLDQNKKSDNAAENKPYDNMNNNGYNNTNNNLRNYGIGNIKYLLNNQSIPDSFYQKDRNMTLEEYQRYLNSTQKINPTESDFLHFKNNIMNSNYGASGIKNNDSSNNNNNNNIISINNNHNHFLNTQQFFQNINKSFSFYHISSSSFKSPVLNEKPKKLLLTGDLFFNQRLIITCQGLENSKRNKNDSSVFFATENVLDEVGSPFNDFIINLNKSKTKKNEEEDEKNLNEEDKNNNNGSGTGNGDSLHKRVFEISYQKNTNEYVLFFMHNSYILYYRINSFIYFELDKEYYFILGTVFLSIMVKNNSDTEKVICIKVETEHEKPKKYHFSHNSKIIRIGRVDSDISIPKTCISKNHSVIEYSSQRQKYYYKDLNSTNGSTLLIREDDYIVIKGTMNFKLEDISFKIKEFA